jgi:AraC-like DNA-binding protein
MDVRIRLTLRVVEEQSASSELNLMETSRLLGLSKAHLLRLFHREIGKTFRRHLRDVRMSRAVDLVKQSTHSIKQIALECGYSDVSNFYRDFKTVHGDTPREVRLKELAGL